MNLMKVVFDPYYITSALSKYTGTMLHQGMLILHQQKTQAPYEQAALSADFVPGMFAVISKKDSVVTLSIGCRKLCKNPIFLIYFRERLYR
ncbi:hypothetical protein ACWHAM_17720 [Paenibacillus terrae]